MNILAIETSCDDTCVAILKKEKKEIKILADFVSSQNDIHANYGGIHPSLAKREHEKNIFPVFLNTLKKAKLLEKRSNDFKLKKETYILLERYPELLKQLEKFLKEYKKPEIKKIAVTLGPGLEPCLWVGINFAKALAINWNIEIQGVDHIEAHLLVNFIKAQEKDIFPALCLIASGGNTKLLLMQKIGIYKVLGETRDDAIGECFDKTARMLNLPYPGGPEISKRAEKVLKSNLNLPRPMIHSKNYDFSFSGLKTAVYYAIKNKKLTKKRIDEYCFEIEQSIVDVILKKTEKGIKEFNPRSIIIGGGVSSNKKIKNELTKLSKKYAIKFISPEHTTDNAVMIGVTALLSPKKQNYDKMVANSNLNLND